MCDIAPFFMKCDLEDYDATCCAFHRIAFALNEVKSEIPILGSFVEPYKCPDFEPKQEEK